jgi:hypothetical protein
VAAIETLPSITIILCELDSLLTATIINNMLREIVIDWFRQQNSENTEVFLSDLTASLDDKYKTVEIKIAVLELKCLV